MSTHLQKIQRVCFQLLIVILIFSSCETTYHTRYNDPNYLNSDEFNSYEDVETLSYTQEKISDIPESIEDSTENYHNTINNYNNYYDFSYAARIKRFYHPSMYYTDYYGGFFTDYYWYTYDPWYWGNSIYLSYNWGWPNHYWTGNYYPYYYSGYYSNLYYSHNHYHHNINKNKYRGFSGSLSSNYLNTNKPKYVNRKLSKRDKSLLELQNNSKSHNNKTEILKNNKRKDSNNSHSYQNENSKKYSPSRSNRTNYNRKSNTKSQRKQNFKRNSRKPRR